MGDPTKDEIRHDITIKFDNMKTVVTGNDFMENCTYEQLTALLIYQPFHLL